MHIFPATQAFLLLPSMALFLQIWAIISVVVLNCLGITHSIIHIIYFIISHFQISSYDTLLFMEFLNIWENPEQPPMA